MGKAEVQIILMTSSELLLRRQEALKVIDGRRICAVINVRYLKVLYLERN